MFWTRSMFTPQRWASPDVSGAVLRAAVHAFQRAEAETAKDPSREARAMAEFAEIVVLPRLRGV
jgi:hypothetical protein